MRDIVCNCNMVDRAAVNAAIHNKKATSIEEISRYTGAVTGCGKCVSYINSILDIEVPKVLTKEPTIKSGFKLW